MLCVLNQFLNYLKIAEVIPIFKKVKPTNYGPISVLFQLDKIFEKMLYATVYKYFEKYNLLSNYQFGFKKGVSTIHAVSWLHI